jgi:hypothetical protein
MMAKKKIAGEGATNKSMPTLLEAKQMPMGMQELDNETLVSLAAMKNHEARIEVLKRNIMVVDQVDYQTATMTFERIQESNHRVGEKVYLLKVRIHPKQSVHYSFS